MGARQNVLDKSMSLHVIKDRMQLTFAEQHANFIADNLETLVDNTYRVAPVRKANHPYPLRRNIRGNLTRSAEPLEKHWEEAIFRRWSKDGACLGSRVPFRRIVSYQVMLRESNDDVGWGELDLLGATAGNAPVAVELKIKPSEYILRAIVEVLAYGVAIRKAWSGIDGCALRFQWAKVVGDIENLVDMPLVVMAPSSYWEVVLRDSAKRTRFQTPDPVRHAIRRLLATMRRVNYPLTFVEVAEKPRKEKGGLPAVTNALVRELPGPTGA